ncbi:sigma 54-interacting transcriptional regulator [Enterococcus devriesei]|uniref:sigma 54-interacting transcriptional regulator n=1 Tax=Enterococcus devriesei TaxID=319970 RepID=UPI001C1065B8|nr:sigma 54-interacting transcriptional regulator [Enterococcus devriesei]MBU5365057.1 sigma 54-interacting transcriptional regulator [Enterococcus devriesei]MDT2821482.1 sigma 54-interacting transcriptional regulator [Enterococcus devriesei]
MKSRKDEVLELLRSNPAEQTAQELADQMGIDRTNISRYLNELTKEGSVKKIDGRPVKFQSAAVSAEKHINFDNLIGREESLKSQIQKSKAAILYPPRGLHTIIFGETGTGKTMFAECMYRFAVAADVLDESAPFITFNCADYAQNPQLLYGHIFGVKRGAFTGAEETREGLMEKADGGILFLDEIHRLPPEGQEMLFTFIDKGTFRSLGDGKEKHASVQIIGATTETSSMFLSTFNRRIPMQIELPSLAERSLDERLGIIKEFLQQEANRLVQEIAIDKRSLLAFLLYKAEGNIGQLKRDLKLVCAKAFLHYQTSNDSEKLMIVEEDLPLVVQKGLLRINEVQDMLTPFLDKKNLYLTLKPGAEDVVWGQDPNKDMEVYNSITYKLEKLGRENLSEIDLEELISDDVDQYFETYVEELSHSNAYREIISDDLWKLVNDLYDFASAKMNREYDEKVRFAFALHINSTIERIRGNQFISHPNLNDIRRNYSKEFLLAIEFSNRIEEAYNIMIPLDEIGFITMFLTMDSHEEHKIDEKQVAILVIMHGKSTASSMLETVQELLGTTKGIAFNMPLTLDTEEMYAQIKNYLQGQRDNFTEGIILLTDMGSPNNFGNLIYHEMGIRTRVISMASTMLVLESLRLATLGRSLEEIYTSVISMFQTMVRLEEPTPKDEKKVIIVACFTGEGVSKRLNEVVSQIVNLEEFEVIQMQSLERESFKHRIDQLITHKDIVAIVGTMEIHYQKIPFIPAMNLFKREKILEFQDLLGSKITLPEMVDSLTKNFSPELDVKTLFLVIDDALQTIRKDQELIIENTALQALSVHIAFLIDKIKKAEERPPFENVKYFHQQNRLCFNQTAASLSLLEKQFSVRFTEDDIAYIVKTLEDNRVELGLHSV